MSTTAVPTETVPTVDLTRPSIPLGRLVAVELRKLCNTRASFWLTAVVVLLNAAILAVGVFTIDDLDFGGTFEIMLFPASLLLPVMAILLVTSEWSQRSALITFGLEPRRHRVVLAKLLTSLAAGVAAVVVAAAFAALATALAIALGDAGAEPWRVTAALFGNGLLAVVLGMLMGFGFGMVLMNSPAAIVLFFALPTMWTLVGSLVAWIRDNLQEWLDFNAASLTLSGPSWPSEGEWARLGTSVAVWVVLPLVLGVWRLLRAEVK